MINISVETASSVGGQKYWFKNTYANKDFSSCDYCRRKVSYLSVIDLQKHILNYSELTPLELFALKQMANIY